MNEFANISGSGRRNGDISFRIGFFGAQGAQNTAASAAAMQSQAQANPSNAGTVPNNAFLWKHQQQCQQLQNHNSRGNRLNKYPEPAEVQILRDTSGYSKSTLEKAATIKLKVEHYYKLAVEQAVERSQRYINQLVKH